MELHLFSWVGILVTVIIATAVMCYIWFIKRNDYYWRKRGVKFVSASDVFSLFNPFNKKPLHKMQIELYKKYGRVSGGVAFGSPTLNIGDPELLKDVLIKDFHNFNYRREFKFGDKVMDNMIMTLKGDDWKRVRTIITPVFTTKKLKMMTNIMNECSENVVNEFTKRVKIDGIADVKSIFGAFTLDVIARAAFATRIISINNPENAFVQNAKRAFQDFSIYVLLLMLFLPTWLVGKLKLGPIKSWAFFKDVILNVIKERKQTGKRYNDILQWFMDSMEEDIKDKAKKVESQKFEIFEDEEDHFGSIINKELSHAMKYRKLSQEEVMAQCVLFFGAGYETAAAALSFVAYALALNPDCQEKLIQEVDTAFKTHNEMNYDAIRYMKYLDCVVSETLRMYPSLIVSERTASEDYELRGTGITIEKGNCIAFPIYAMHYDPEYFTEPEKFKPERFIEPTHPQLAYLPFGAGPRNCLGMRFALMEIKMCLSNVLHNFRFHLAKTTKVPMEFKNGIGFLTVDQLPLKIEKRTDI